MFTFQITTAHKKVTLSATVAGQSLKFSLNGLRYTDPGTPTINRNILLIMNEKNFNVLFLVSISNPKHKTTQTYLL